MFWLWWSFLWKTTRRFQRQTADPGSVSGVSSQLDLLVEIHREMFGAILTEWVIYHLWIFSLRNSSSCFFLKTSVNEGSEREGRVYVRDPVLTDGCGDQSSKGQKTAFQSVQITNTSSVSGWISGVLELHHCHCATKNKYFFKNSLKFLHYSNGWYSVYLIKISANEVT